ncbi:MAG: hypothetical protein FWD73_17850 [Polyangiaceae bacterium]|nr:hypothetical protein [Polyangiaceae bacterium]
MKIDLSLPAFSVTALCQVKLEAALPSGTPCEIYYARAPDGVERDVRVYVIGQASADAGDDVGVVLGFLCPEAHRDALMQDAHIELRRGTQVLASGRVILCAQRA